MTKGQWRQYIKNPIDDFHLTKDDFKFIGHDLYRPECILTKRDGTLWCADSRGGVQKILPDGTQELISDNKHTGKNQNLLTGTDLPNGLCFAKNGDIYIANQGKGCLELMDLNGNRKTILDSFEGKPLGVINFVLRDKKERLWVSVSTRHKLVVEVMKPDVADGYIILIDKDTIRIVADGIALTNEIRLDKDENYMYISETFGRRISRMKVSDNGDLHDRETFGPSDLGPAGFPDGIAFDSYGNLWGTITCGERIFAITPEGDLRIIFDDRNVEACKKIDEEFFKGTLTQEMIFSGLGSIAPAIASINFGGRNLDTVYVGSLFETRIPYFTAPVAGEPPVWW
ncbi:MAG: hypothetical protein K940chlam3_00573 [Chlamydiae bacterium]|nr:hypothetical protein [Chlamydiota bacterium]